MPTLNGSDLPRTTVWLVAARLSERLGGGGGVVLFNGTETVLSRQGRKGPAPWSGAR